MREDTFEVWGKNQQKALDLSNNPGVHTGLGKPCSLHSSTQGIGSILRGSNSKTARQGRL